VGEIRSAAAQMTTARTEHMDSVSTTPPEKARRLALFHARGTAKAEMVAEILQAYPGLSLSSSIAVLGDRAADFQAALAARGFSRVLTIVGGVRLGHEVHHCICLVNDAADRWVSADALASLKRPLMPGGALMIEVSHDMERIGVFESGLRSVGFSTVHYRVLGRPPIGQERSVFMIAQTARWPSTAAARSWRPEQGSDPIPRAVFHGR
jgi:hypothetical protein